MLENNSKIAYIDVAEPTLDLKRPLILWSYLPSRRPVSSRSKPSHAQKSQQRTMTLLLLYHDTGQLAHSEILDTQQCYQK
jgi:hypothetical protein